MTSGGIFGFSPGMTKGVDMDECRRVEWKLRQPPSLPSRERTVRHGLASAKSFDEPREGERGTVQTCECPPLSACADISPAKGGRVEELIPPATPCDGTLRAFTTCRGTRAARLSRAINGEFP